MNSWLRALLYLFAFLLLFVWVGLGLFDAERAKGPIASWISQQTGVPVTIGRLVFNPLHPYTLLAEQVQYGDAVQLEKIYLEIDNIDWLNRDVRIAHLDLIRPVIKLPLPNTLPTLPVHSLTISDSTIDRLSLHSDELTLSGLNATLNDWQLLNPVRPPQANLSLNINELETPASTRGELPTSLPEAQQSMVENNPYLKSAQADVQSAESQYEVAKSPFYPRFDAEAAVGANNNVQGDEGHDNEWRVGVVMNYNLFRGGSDKARLASDAHQINQAMDIRNNALRHVEVVTALKSGFLHHSF